MQSNKTNQKWELKSRIPEILGIKYPIVQGAMSWMTDARLVAAVSNAGGLGMLGPHAGQTTNPSSNEEVVERMRAEIRKVKSLTDKPFAMPIVTSYDLSTVPMMLDLLIKEQVPVVLLNGFIEGAIDEKVFETLKKAGIKIILRDHNLQVALKAQECGADIFVTTGFDEGGTVPDKVIGTFSATTHIAQALDIPVMVAGGIADVNGVRASFALGAEGVYAGTLFLATEESRMAENVKQMLIRSTADDLLLFRTLPAYYRSLPTKLAHTLVEMDNAGASRQDIAKVMNGGVGMRAGMLEGDLENGYISLGNGITLINEIRPVKEVINDLMRDFI